MKNNKFSEEINELMKNRLPIKKKSNTTKRFTKEKNNDFSLDVNHFISSKKQINLSQNQANRKYKNNYYLVVNDYKSLIQKKVISQANIKTGRAPLSAVKLFTAMINEVASKDYEQTQYFISLEDFGKITGQISETDSKEKINQTKKNIKRQAVKDIELLSLLQVRKTLNEDLEDDSVAGKSIMNIFGLIEVTNKYLLKFELQPTALNKLKAGSNFKMKDNEILLMGKTTLLVQTELFLESKLSGKIGDTKKVVIQMKDLYNYIEGCITSYKELEEKREKYRWKEQIRDKISNVLLSIQEEKIFSFDFEPCSDILECEKWEDFLNTKIIVAKWQEE